MKVKKVPDDHMQLRAAMDCSVLAFPTSHSLVH